MNHRGTRARAGGDVNDAARALYAAIIHNTDKLSDAEDQHFSLANRNAAGDIRWLALAGVGEDVGKPHTEPSQAFYIHPAANSRKARKVAELDAKSGPRPSLPDQVLGNTIRGILEHHHKGLSKRERMKSAVARIIFELRSLLRSEIAERVKPSERADFERTFPPRKFDAIRRDIERDDLAVEPIDFTILTCTNWIDPTR